MPMKWRKAPQELVDLFSEIVPDDPRVERRKMFGYPCAFSGGNMFIGLHQENMVLRLPDDDRAQFLEIQGAAIFQPMPGRTMREYVVVPTHLMGDRKTLAKWVKKSLDYAASLPAKKAKPARKKSRK